MEKSYIGNELDLFNHATNWKNYWSDLVIPYLGNTVLEVGAGLGGTTRVLTQKAATKKWICLEPDVDLASHITEDINSNILSDICQVKIGTLDNLSDDLLFDSILYIDVIEHIEDDKKELLKAASFLKKNGYLIIVVPAHNFLYSDFDKAIGHYRRYNKKMVLSAIPDTIETIRCSYLDSVGMIASLSNKMMLHQSYPTLKQIKLWDKNIIPVSKIVDKLLLHSVGKSVLYIGKRL